MSDTEKTPEQIRNEKEVRSKLVGQQEHKSLDEAMKSVQDQITQIHVDTMRGGG